MFAPEPWSFTIPISPLSHGYSRPTVAVSEARRVVVAVTDEGMVGWKLRRGGKGFRKAAYLPRPFVGPDGQLVSVHSMAFSGRKGEGDLLIYVREPSFTGGKSTVLKWDLADTAQLSGAPPVRLPLALEVSDTLFQRLLVHEDMVLLFNYASEVLSVWRRLPSGRYTQQWVGVCNGISGLTMLDAPNNDLYILWHHRGATEVVSKVHFSNDGTPGEVQLVSLLPTAQPQFPPTILNIWWDDGVYILSHEERSASGNTLFWRAESVCTGRPPLLIPDAMMTDTCFWSSFCMGHGVQIVINEQEVAQCHATLWATPAGRRCLRPLRFLSWLAVCC